MGILNGKGGRPRKNFDQLPHSAVKIWGKQRKWRLRSTQSPNHPITPPPFTNFERDPFMGFSSVGVKWRLRDALGAVARWRMAAMYPPSPAVACGRRPGRPPAQAWRLLFFLASFARQPHSLARGGGS